MTKAATQLTTKTSEKSCVKKSSDELFEEQLQKVAVEAREYTLSRLTIPFLKNIKEVVAKRSQYDTDKCFASISFKNGKRASVALDYDVPAEPGDKLKLSTLQWKTFTNDDGSEFRCITGMLQ